MPTLTNVNTFNPTPALLEDSGAYVAINFGIHLKGIANESSDTDGFQIRGIAPGGKLYVKVGATYKEIVNGTGTDTATTIYFDFDSYNAANSGTSATTSGLTIRQTGVFINNTQISGTDASLYWRPTTADTSGATDAFYIRAIDAATNTTWNNGDDLISDTDRTVRVNVTSVNDAPTFDVPTEVVRDEDAGAQTVQVVTNVTAGGGESQTTTISMVGSTNAELFAVGPAIDAAGNLTFTAAANASGTSTVTVKVQDSGGTANGGVDTTTKTFNIVVNAVNDDPVNSVPVGAQSTSGGSLTFSAAGSNALSISDIDAGTAATMSTTVAVNSGTLAVMATGHGAGVTGSGTNSVVISGTVAQVNAALEGLKFTSAGSDATLTMTTSDGASTGSGGAKTDVDTVFIGVAPAVTSVTVPEGGLYNTNDVLTFTVTFDSAVDVTGTPRLVLDIGGTPAYATYTGGTGTTSLTFEYTVVDGQNDADGITVGGSIDANGGAIDSSGIGNQPASLALVNVGSTTGVIVDTDVPAPGFDLAEDTGSNTGDAYTSNGQVDVTLATDVDSWEYTTDGGETWQEGTGTSFTLEHGTYGIGDIGVRQTDEAGNDSVEVFSEDAVTIDTEVEAPSASFTDSAAADGITNIGTVNVTGIEAGATWEYTLNGTDWVDGVGTSFILGHGLNANVGVRQTDLAGNESEASSLGAITLDLVVDTPSFALAEDTGQYNNDRVTSNGTVNVTGLESGASWQYNVNGGGWQNGTGSSFTLAAGEYLAESIQVRQTDVAGNVSDAQVNAGAITVDVTYPSAATITAPADTGTPFDSIPNDNGTPDPEDDFDVPGLNTDGVTALNTFGVTVNGGLWKWEYSINGGESWATGTGVFFNVADGTYEAGDIRVRQTDVAGNEAITSFNNTIVVDTLDPTVTLAQIAGDGTIDYTEGQGSITLTGTVTDSYSAYGLVEIQFYDAEENAFYEFPITRPVEDGVWSLELTSEDIDLLGGLNNVATYTVVVTGWDQAGNDGGDSRTLTVNLTPPPEPPTMLDLYVDSDSAGVSNSDNVTFDDTPTFTGVSEIGTTVTVYHDANNNSIFDEGDLEIGSAEAGVSGYWTVTAEESLSDNLYNIRAYAENETGAKSASSGAIAVTIDTVAGAPTVSLDPQDDTGTGGDGRTNLSEITLTGTAEAGATVTVTSFRNVLSYQDWQWHVEEMTFTGTANESGEYSIDVTAPGAWWFDGSNYYFDYAYEGTATFSVTQTDVAGNESEAASFDVNFDFTGDEFYFDMAAYDRSSNVLTLTGSNFLFLGEAGEDITDAVDLDALNWYTDWWGSYIALNDYAEEGSDGLTVTVLNDNTITIAFDDSVAEYLESSYGFGTEWEDGDGLMLDYLYIDGAFQTVDDAGNVYRPSASVDIQGPMAQVDVPISYTLELAGLGSILTNDTFGEEVSLMVDEELEFPMPAIIDTTDCENFSDMYVVGSAADMSIQALDFFFPTFSEGPPAFFAVFTAGVFDGRLYEEWNEPVFEGEQIVDMEYHYDQFYGAFGLVAELDFVYCDALFDSRENGITFDDGSFVLIHMGDGTSMTLRGERGADQLQAGDAGDRLLGNAGDDLLIGGEGSDAIYGGTGNDIIFGGGGNDYLSGGSGSDDFLFAAGGDSCSTNVVITDFDTAKDEIYIADAYSVDYTQSGSDTVISINEGEQMIRVLGKSVAAVQGATIENAQFNIAGYSYGYGANEEIFLG